MPTNHQNLLLRTMNAKDRRRIETHLEPVDLSIGSTLFAPFEPIEHLYLLEGGVASVTGGGAEQAGEVEIGVIGHEGLVGIPILLGTDRSPNKCMVQVDGLVSYRISAPALLDICRDSDTLQPLLLRYVQSFLLQAAQTAAVNARCDLSTRLARWLLMCHDRIEGDRLTITHEFMAMMLGVRRAGVTVTLHKLEESGAVRSERGCVTVIDRTALEDIAGEAYGTPEAEYRRLVGPFGKAAA